MPIGGQIRVSLYFSVRPLAKENGILGVVRGDKMVNATN